MVEKTDAVIIGGGLSGLVCGLKLANEGFDVILVEKNSSFGEQTRPKLDITESLGLESIFQELNLPLSDRSNVSHWHSPSEEFIFQSKIEDFFIKRGPQDDSFDSIVGNLIQDAGVTVFLSSDLRKITSKGDRVEKVQIYKDETLVEIKPKYFIGADGSRGKSATLLPRLPKSYREVTIVGYGEVGSNLDMPSSETNVFLNAKYAPGGYFYTAQTKNNFAFSMAVLNKSKMSLSPFESYNSFVSNTPLIKKFLGGRTKHTSVAGLGKAKHLDSRALGNSCLIGDAGGVLDPLFGYGARQGICSAYLAAQSIVQAEKRGLSDLNHYENSLREQLLINERNSYRLREIFDGLNNADYDRILFLANVLKKKKDLDSFIDNPERNLKLILSLISTYPLKTIPLMIKARGLLFSD